jgi:phosphomevalonate kinase
MQTPNLILIFSGKRKSGKDFICQKLRNHFQRDKFPNLKLTLITLSSPLKEIYAKEHNLDYERLLDSSDYKEKYRLEMIKYNF